MFFIYAIVITLYFFGKFDIFLHLKNSHMF